MGYISGWGGGVKVAWKDSSLAIPVTHWQVQAETELVDVTAGFQTIISYIPGYTDISATVDCFWHTDLELLSPNALTKPRLRPGDTVRLYLFLDACSNFSINTAYRVWRLPNFIISSFTMEQEVRGILKYTLQGKQSGNTYQAYPSNVALYNFSRANLNPNGVASKYFTKVGASGTQPDNDNNFYIPDN